MVLLHFIAFCEGSHISSLEWYDIFKDAVNVYLVFDSHSPEDNYLLDFWKMRTNRVK